MRPAHSNAVIFIVGPTAVGKTRLAASLARRVTGEVISADSMQVYKGMRILSQAPSAAEKKRARHHLVESLDPAREYSAAIFAKKAAVLIASMMKRKSVPIVAGGSGLYVRALVDGLFASPEADMKFRLRMQKFGARYGRGKLHARLVKIDPEAAATIHPNDMRRVIRALEIYDSTGKTMTELKLSTRGIKDRYGIKIFGLTMPREDIYSNIDARVDSMFRAGVVGEVKRLRRKRLSKTAAEVLGFNEISGYLDGTYGIDAAKEMLKMNTRRFAKRQLTWFRPDKRIEWFDAHRSSDKDIIKRMIKSWKERF